MSVVDNAAAHRFELEEQGQTAFADYRREEGMLVVTHVEAAPALRGTGAAGRLMEGLLQQAASRGERVLPLCAYADAYMRRHKAWDRLRAG